MGVMDHTKEEICDIVWKGARKILNVGTVFYIILLNRCSIETIIPDNNLIAGHANSKH